MVKKVVLFKRGGKMVKKIVNVKGNWPKKLTKPAAKAVTAIAKKVFNKKVETKYAGPTGVRSYGESNIIPGDAIYGATLPTGGVPQLFTCIPQISQGDTTYQRQGNKINPTRHVTQLEFVFNPSAIIGTTTGARADQAGWDITVHVWYGFAKRYKRVSDVVTNEVTLLQSHLQDGQGGQFEWNGLLTDETLDVDKEIFTFKHKKFRMYKNAGLANVGDVTSPSLSTPMLERHAMTINWKAPKTLLYGEEANLVPENYAPFIVVGYCHNDGTPASNTANTGPTTDMTRIPALIMFKADKLYYKDA